MNKLVVQSNIKTIEFANCKLKKFILQTYIIENNVNDIYADIIIDDNKLLSYMRDGKNDENKRTYLIKVLMQKIDKTFVNALKNDGIFMSLISYKFIQEYFGVKVLYLMSYNDFEKAKFGMDSVFFSNDQIYIIEYKTSINELSAAGLSDIFIEGVNSLYFKESFDLATIEHCNDIIDDLEINGEKLKETLNYYQDNKHNIIKLLENQNLNFHICIVSPLKCFTEKELSDYIEKKYFSCLNCPKHEHNGEKCIRNPNIKVDSAVSLQLSSEFTLEELHKSLINKLGVR